VWKIASGPRCPFRSAISRASITSVAEARLETLQPTIIFEARSITTARYAQPS